MFFDSLSVAKTFIVNPVFVMFDSLIPLLENTGAVLSSFIFISCFADTFPALSIVWMLAVFSPSVIIVTGLLRSFSVIPVSLPFR